MIKQTALAAFVVLSFGMTGAEAAGHGCIALGGNGLANAIDDTNFVASLGGGLAGGARAAITEQRETETGLLLNMTHHFYTDAGGLLETNDVATLTAVPGRPQTFMLEISYDIVRAVGALEGYEGSFQSFGLIKLDEGKVVLRYQGEICK